MNLKQFFDVLRELVRTRERITFFTKWINWTGYRNPKVSDALILSRQVYTDQSTIGELCIDGNHECWTLEPPSRKGLGKAVAIPAGKYELQMLWSTRFKMDVPFVLNVPNRTAIEIHPGNFPKDTSGCIIVGENKDTNYVSDSRKTYRSLVKKIESKLAQGKCWIEILGGTQHV